MPTYTQATGFPRKDIDKGGNSITDRLYGAWADALEYRDKEIGTPSEIDPSLSLAKISISRNESGLIGYIDLTYHPRETVESGGVVDSGKPVWTCRVGILEKPVETHADYRTKWNYDLYAKSGYENTLPAWFNTAINLTTDTSGNYIWAKSQNETPVQDNGKHWGLVTGGSKILPGVESYILPSPIVESTFYYSSLVKTYSSLSSVGTKTAPAKTFGITGGEWLVMGAEVARDGKKWVLHTTFQWANEWKALLYT